MRVLNPQRGETENLSLGETRGFFFVCVCVCVCGDQEK